MSPDIKNTFSHQDLRWGWTVNVPRHVSHPAKAAVASCVVGAHQNRTLLEVVGTNYQLFANYSSDRDGNAFFVIAAGSGMKEVVVTDQPLYMGVVACARETAPYAWRHIMQRYLPVVASAPPRTIVSAPGLMPKQVPWLCGFSDPSVGRLALREREDLVAVARIAGSILLAICERGWARTKQSGRDVVLNPDDYPELQDWEE